MINKGLIDRFEDIFNSADYMVLTGNIDKIEEKKLNKKDLNVVLNAAVHFDKHLIVQYLFDTYDLLLDEYKNRNQNPYIYLTEDTNKNITQLLIDHNIPIDINLLTLYNNMKKHNMFKDQKRHDILQLIEERKKEERLEAEKLEAKRLEAERLEAERLEAKRLEAERLEAEKLEAEMQFKAKTIIFNCFNSILIEKGHAISFSNLQEYTDLGSRSDLNEFQKAKIAALEKAYIANCDLTVTDFIDKMLIKITNCSFVEDRLDLGDLSILFEDIEMANKMFCELLSLFTFYEEYSITIGYAKSSIKEYKDAINDESNQKQYMNDTIKHQGKLINHLDEKVHDLGINNENLSKYIIELQNSNRKLSEKMARLEAQISDKSVGHFTQKLNEEQNNRAIWCNIL